MGKEPQETMGLINKVWAFISNSICYWQSWRDRDEIGRLMKWK